MSKRSRLSKSPAKQARRKSLHKRIGELAKSSLQSCKRKATIGHANFLVLLWVVYRIEALQSLSMEIGNLLLKVGLVLNSGEMEIAANVAKLLALFSGNAS